MSTALKKIDQALARGWSRRMPAWCGPCTFNRMNRRERETVLRGIQRGAVDNTWPPVAAAKKGSK